MVQVFERQKFSDLQDQDSGAVFEDLEFRRCTFTNSGIFTYDLQRRTTIRNVKFVNCTVKKCSLYGAVVEDVSVEGRSRFAEFCTNAAVFKHVTIRGKLGIIRILPRIGFVFNVTDPLIQSAFDLANAAYYETVDWALDISAAEFYDLDVYCIPARLIRRDPATQLVVTREKALEGVWRSLDLSETHWPWAIENLLLNNTADTVLVAPKGHPNFKRLLEGLQILRDAGVAQPD
jgi:hypothetical protein